jgi:hypothetical protein
MEKFTPITTQEQFDAAIEERLKREREAISKKYGDYDDLKTKVSDYETQIGDLTRTIEENEGKCAGYDKTLADMEAKLKGYEIGSVKTRIALESGLPYAMAARLSGETEAEIQKDAKTLVQLMESRSPKAPPLRSNEQTPGDTKRDALRALNAQLTDND